MGASTTEPATGQIDLQPMTSPERLAGDGDEDFESYLAAQGRKSLLRFITCGSVDDGKSTLIGRLLYETKALFEDQLAALDADSRRFGTQGAAPDLALLVDGLAAEREQGITIDVAYRFFSTPKRKFIVADTPGHEQYTRNMVTGASTADLAVILVDARKGLLTQTRRHSFLVSLLGVRRAVLAVNKMDLVGFSPDVFHAIVEDYRAFAARLGLSDIVAIPLSGLTGDNVVERSLNTLWYDGPTLLEHLETVQVDEAPASAPFRLPVQWVNRPSPEFRGFSGLVASGRIAPGERVRVLPSGRESRIARIVTYDGDPAQAVAGQSVTLTLEDEVDISRGDLIAAAASPPEVSDQFDATLVWMSDAPLFVGRSYWLKLAGVTAPAQVSRLRAVVDVNTQAEHPARTLACNEIGRAELSVDRPIAFAPYAENRDLGGFILIDRQTNETVGAGVVNFGLRRGQNSVRQPVKIDKSARAALAGQRPAIVWFTGIPSAGKSTVANLVEQALHAEGRLTYLLDGDNLRHGLNRDLGYTDSDRVENVRRLAEVARLMLDAGLVVLVSAISPFRAERRYARSLVDPGEFIEVFVDAPLEVAEARDGRGLYSKARAGLIPNFTPIGSAYEPPEQPEVHLHTDRLDADSCAQQVLDALAQR